MAKITIKGGVKSSGGIILARFNIPPAWDTLEGSLGTPLESQAFSVPTGATDPDTFPDPTITYSVAGGSLPSGLGLNTSTGEISGTPDAVGSDTLSSFTLRAADGTIGANQQGKFDERDFSITIADDNPPTFDITSLGLGSVAESQNTTVTIPTITATDNNTVTQTITFSEVTSTLTTENLSIDANTGVISGVPGTVGGTRTLAFTLRASTPTNNVDRDYEIIVTDAQDPVWVTAIGLLATVNESEAITTITLEATDDNAVSYSVTSGALPGGLSLNASTGDITGTPSNVTEDTTFDFEVTATDTVELDFTARCFAIKVLNVIANSLRFNDNDSPKMTWTPGVAQTDTDIGTIAHWFKLGNLGVDRQIYNAGSGNEIFIGTGDVLVVRGGGAWNLTISAKLRDPSAWYHLVVAYDTTQGTAANRVKIYLNGSQITDFNSETYPAQNLDVDFFKNAQLQTIGANESGTEEFDGYFAEFFGIDGQQLTATDFGAFDTNGDWQPKEYSGGFGTNGFHLDYAVAPGTGDGGGTDVSGNANHFTDSGLAANDQVPDTPTNNYCVMVPTSPDGWTTANGNLEVSSTSGNDGNIVGTFGVSSGKWFWEVDMTATGRGNIGVVLTQGSMSTSDAVTYNDSGQKNLYGSFTAYGATYGDNIIGIALNLDDLEIEFFKDNVSQGTITGLTAGTYLPFSRDSSGGVAFAQKFNFGQLGFINTPPTGFLALNTKNLPTPTIADPGDHFSAKLYTGNATASTSIIGIGFQPDLVWIKNRSQADEHKLIDAVRGATKELSSDSVNNETTDANGLTAFNSDGFELGTGANGYNDSGESFVAWNWNESATPGFDIVSYTGNGANRTISHSLSAIPDMMIVKGLTNIGATNWRVYHSSNTSAPETDNLLLDSTNATSDSNTIWNDTAPTTSVFSLGTSNSVNKNTDTFINYLWVGVESFSRFSSYTGNGSTDGPFVWCGFRPAFTLIKRTDSTASWFILDSIREQDNPAALTVFADLTQAETTQADIDYLANGFKLRSSGTAINASGGTFVFAAFAESPFKTARAR